MNPARESPLANSASGEIPNIGPQSEPVISWKGRVWLFLQSLPVVALCKTSRAAPTKIGQLPSEWTYGEQIFRQNDKNAGAVAIRDRFSSKPGKRASPRTVDEFRKSHKKEVEVTYTLQVEKSVIEGLTVPAGVILSNVEKKPDLVDISCTFTVPRNTYLLEKGHKEHNKSK